MMSLPLVCERCRPCQQLSSTPKQLFQSELILQVPHFMLLLVLRSH